MSGTGESGGRRRGFWYWFVRLLVLAMVGSVWINLPRYLHGMDQETYVVWLARVLWVVGLPAVFAGVIAIVGRRWRR